MKAIAIGVALLVACTAAPTEVVGVDHSPDTANAGYCRTRTCAAPAGYPTDGLCAPVDWSDSSTCVGKESNAPLFWRSACVGYDLNQSASRRVSYDAFATAVEAAFGSWSGATCAETPSSLQRHVSIEARDLGPVSCARTEYNRNGPNQNVIVFHDDAWPHEIEDQKKTGSSISTTIALTTVTSDVRTGEIFDADVELNSADYDIVAANNGSPLATDTYDLQAILTHELGHILGLGHSPDLDAVMYAFGDVAGNGGGRLRSLTAADVAGICSIYPPDGTRNVSLLISPIGSIEESACDPTPRHGFTTTCP